MTQIARTNRSAAVTIANGVALSDAFSLEGYSRFVVLMPAAWTAASIGFQVALTQDGTYFILYDDDGNLLQIDSPAVDKAYSAPEGVFASYWIKLWSQDGSASATNQAAERSLSIMRKA